MMKWLQNGMDPLFILEYEPKQPQLEPKVPGNDPQGLLNARPDRTEPLSVVLLSYNPLLATSRKFYNFS
jgi:hypothetical protein